MFQPNDPTLISTEPADFQIDPIRSPYFQILQPDPSDRWLEVGFVWTMGTSRTSSVENWYLYDRVPTGSALLAAYTWPGYDASGRLSGMNLRLVPATAPAGETPSTMTTYLQRNKGVSLTYVKGSMAAGGR